MRGDAHTRYSAENHERRELSPGKSQRSNREKSSYEKGRKTDYDDKTYKYTPAQMSSSTSSGPLFNQKRDKESKNKKPKKKKEIKKSATVYRDSERDAIYGPGVSSTEDTSSYFPRYH